MPNILEFLDDIPKENEDVYFEPPSVSPRPRPWGPWPPVEPEENL